MLNASTSMNDAVETLAPGYEINGRYRIDRAVGVGTMGVVYAAWNIVLDLPVTLQVLDPSTGRFSEIARSFVEETRGWTQQRSPNAVGLLDFGHDEVSGIYFIVQEHLPERGSRTSTVPPPRQSVPPSYPMLPQARSLPSSVPPQVLGALSPARSPVSRRTLALGAVALALGLGGAWFVTTRRHPIAVSVSVVPSTALRSPVVLTVSTAPTDPPATRRQPRVTSATSRGSSPREPPRPPVPLPARDSRDGAPSLNFPANPY